MNPKIAHGESKIRLFTKPSRVRGGSNKPALYSRQYVDYFFGLTELPDSIFSPEEITASALSG